MKIIFLSEVFHACTESQRTLNKTKYNVNTKKKNKIHILSLTSENTEFEGGNDNSSLNQQ